MNIAYLEISSWIGYSGDAEHVYGELVYILNDKTKYHKLKKRLNKKDSEALIKKGGNFSHYQIGKMTDRFNNEEELIQNAIKYVKSRKLCIDLILEGQNYIASVQKALYGDPKIVTEINKLKMEWNKVYNENCMNDKEFDKIDNKFIKIIEGYNK